VRLPKVCTIDFETYGIEGRPAYPPVPVGVSIKPFGRPARYWAWGHVSGGNNCTKERAIQELRRVWDSPGGLLFHNGRFDLDVAETHLGLPIPSPERVHDTLFLLFLSDPHAWDLGLKPSAKRLLDMEPEERDFVFEWLKEHQPVPNVKIRTIKKAGAYIAYAPGDVVTPYANGDVDRTFALFELLYPKIVDAGMEDAYLRERRLLPIFLDMERQGVRIDLDRLKADIGLYQGWQVKIDTWLRRRLKVGPEINLRSDKQLLPILIELGLLDTSKMSLTAKTGQISLAGDSLLKGLRDPVLASVLQYTSQLSTCLGTFMEPWAATAERSGGLIYTSWNQVRSPDGGTRTGRLSSSHPNFQNIPKEFALLFDGLDERGRKLPRCPWRDLPPLPLCRSYVVPYLEGDVLADRDYSQQEPRILGHFEGGALMQAYLDDPWIDYHDNAKDNLERVFARPFKRKPVKNVNLGIIYGQGIGSLAEKNGESYEDTKILQNAILDLYPGLKTMRKDMKARSIAGEPIRTWGGRVYYCEPPKFIEGKLRTFDYKLVNVLVQGSAADCTKEALIRFYRVKRAAWRVLLQVHDELLVSCPAAELVECMEVLRQTMESVEFDVQILSEGAWSFNNWAVLEDYDKKGRAVCDRNKLPRQRKGSPICLSETPILALPSPVRSRRSNHGAGAGMTSTLSAR
jgi:DNA polymerase-1